MKKCKYSFYPRAITWEITNKCNLSCEMCWLWGKKSIGKSFIQKELSLDEVKKIALDISEFKPIIYLTGGEPFIRKDIMEIIEYLKSKGLCIALTTNGTLITKKIGKKLVGKLDGITFSLDGSAEVHNRIRGKGNFEKAISGLKSILDARLGLDLPIVRINFTISNQNYNILHDMVDLSEELEVDILQFNHLWFTDKKSADLHYLTLKNLFGIECKGIYGYVSEIKIDPLLLHKEIEAIKNKKTGLYITFNPDLNSKSEIQKYYTDPKFKFKKRCLYPWFSARIMPNGDLSPCLDYHLSEYLIGNLKQNTFKELWNSEKYRYFRKILKEKESFPGCSRCCGLFAF